MRYEFVEFYPLSTNEKKGKKAIGTCHIYAIDIELDIRGIVVSKTPKGFFYHFPHAWQIDPETNKREKYPILRFTNEDKHQELLKFMFDEVTPIIKEKLNPKMKIA